MTLRDVRTRLREIKERTYHSLSSRTISCKISAEVDIMQERGEGGLGAGRFWKIASASGHFKAVWMFKPIWLLHRGMHRSSSPGNHDWKKSLWVLFGSTLTWDSEEDRNYFPILHKALEVYLYPDLRTSTHCAFTQIYLGRGE